MSKIIIVALLTIAILIFDYKKNKNLKKTLTASLLFSYIIAIGFSGITLTRAMPFLFFIHMLAVIVAYASLIYYIFREKLYWQILILPLIIIAIYVGLNFLEGSRYEK